MPVMDRGEFISSFKKKDSYNNKLYLPKPEPVPAQKGNQAMAGAAAAG